MKRLIPAILLAAVLLAVHPLVFAEPAPVYDADENTPAQEFENVGQDEEPVLPAQARESTDNDRAFVPERQVAAGTMAPTEPIINNETRGSVGERLNQIEKKFEAFQPVQVKTRVEMLQKELQMLRGQVEQLTHQIQQLQNQQKGLVANAKLVKDNGETASPTTLAKNVKNSAGAVNADIKAGTSTVTKTTTTETIAAEDGAEEQQIYQSAYNLIKAKKYSEAISVLQKMLQKKPSGQFAGNAHYWLGELYGLMGKHAQALVEFSTVVKNYPNSSRVADAQLKVGLIYASQFKWAEAKLAFKKVISTYPGSASSRLALEQLKEIKAAGH